MGPDSGGFQKMNNRVQKMVTVSMLAAMGTVLQFVAFPLLPSFTFLKLDFSDIPIMVGMFLFGPVAGVSSAFIRSLLHLFLTGFTLSNLVGDSASFLATILFTLPMYYFFNRGSHKIRNKIAGTVTGILSMVAVMSIANYFIITPMFLKAMGTTMDQFLGLSMPTYVSVAIIPFNLLKGIIVSGVFLVLHAKLLPWLNQKQAALLNRSSVPK